MLNKFKLKWGAKKGNPDVSLTVVEILDPCYLIKVSTALNQAP